MRSFQYLRASSQREACELLADRGDDARVLAGGQSLLNMMKLRILSPAALIDVHRVSELQEVSPRETGLSIGSMATYASLAAALHGNARYAVLTDAIEVIADMHVRHMGTMGGSCCHADPFGDMPNVASALMAEFEICNVKGRRRIAADEFFLGPFETSIASTEMLSSIYIPAPSKGSGSAYEKFSWRRGDYAIVSVAVVLRLDDAGSCLECRLIGGSLSSGPVRFAAGEQILIGRVPTEDVILEAAKASAAECEPKSDRLYGSTEYKRLVIETLVNRSVHRACERGRFDWGGR